MIVMDVGTEDQPRLEGRVRLFRGMTPHSDPGAFRGLGVRPPQPLDGVNEWAALYRSGVTIDHVRGAMRQRARSFTFDLKCAMWWGTGGGTQDGYVAIWDATIARSTSYGGGTPYHHLTSEGQVLLDPRFLPNFAPHNPLLIQMVRNYSRVDQEVLLIGGHVRPVRIVQVRASQCPKNFVPYDFWGQKFVPFQGMWLDANMLGAG
jgi:hypothetical protein